MSTTMHELAWQNRYDQDSLEQHFDLQATAEAEVALGGTVQILQWRREAAEIRFPARQTGADFLG